MKEIGESLKEAREEMGISYEEAAEDLKLVEDDIKNIEEGNVTYFKDIFYLKTLIKDYSKYLGLNSEKMLDDFNEYLFDYTSKISLDDIQKAKKKREKEDKKKEKRVASPYTLDVASFLTLPRIIILVVVLLIVLTLGVYFLDINILTGGII